MQVASFSQFLDRELLVSSFTYFNASFTTSGVRSSHDLRIIWNLAAKDSLQTLALVMIVSTYIVFTVCQALLKCFAFNPSYNSMRYNYSHFSVL